MPPKPRMIQRRLSSATGTANPMQKTPNPQSMPPPPVPANPPAPASVLPPPPPPPPRGILVPEASALHECFRSAVVKTAEIYRFYTSAKRFRIDDHASHPTRTMVAGLGREVERYDQLCDAMQSQLERAIAILKRDLKREQDRLKAVEAEAAARAAAAAAPPPQEPPLASPIQEDPSSILSPTTPSSKGPSLSARRQSTISLSSLQRPPFPHKLDLSSAALRLDPNDPILHSAMASPVTLAPKTSLPRANDFSFDTSQQVDIDLTLGDDVVPSVDVDHSLGNSADKPIELDLELDMDLFGDTSVGASIMGGDMGLANPTTVKQEEPVELDLFSGLSADDSAKTNAALLAAAQAIPPDVFTSSQGSIPGITQSTESILDAFNPVATSSDGGKPAVPDNLDDFSELQQLLQ